jgi:hypothetical protein
MSALPPPPPPAPAPPKRRWKPTVSTWIAAPLVLLLLILGLATSGASGLLIFLALVGLITALYTVVTRRASWAGLPRSRPLAGAIAGGAVVLLIVGSSIGGAAHTELATSTSATHSASAAPRALVDKSATVSDVRGKEGAAASDDLTTAGFRVQLQSADGSAVVETADMIVVSQNPPAGAAMKKGAVVTLTMAAPTPTTPSPTPTVASPEPAPVVAPAPAPAKPAPAPVAPKPAPAPPAAPPAPAPAPPPAATGTIIPGAFCSPSDVGKAGVAANGRTYVCGGKGADASGHYHWNS